MTGRYFLIAILLTVSSLISWATEYYVAMADLNVRAGPGIRHDVSFALQKGEEVEVLSKLGDWWMIRFQGKTGYAYGTYLKSSRTTVDETKSFKGTLRIVDVILTGVYLVLALVVGSFIYEKVRKRRLLKSVTDFDRGTPTERELVLKLLKFGIPAERIFHDLYVQKSESDFSQIDLVVVSDVGIVVFEVKEFSGWIYGNGDERRWTKVLAYGKQKYRFYNPIMQNNRHVNELRKKLMQFGDIPFYSVVVFYGDCVLKNIEFVPRGTFLVKAPRILEVMRVILNDNIPIQYVNSIAMIRILREAVINGGIAENQLQHAENIRDMLGKDRIFD